MSSPQWRFATFRLDPATARIWRGEQAMTLRPKAFDVLHYLVTHADRLVTKDELLEAVWPETTVTDAVVRIAIGALRKALGDTARTPHYIATVARRGYRFLAPVTCIEPTEFTPLPSVLPLSPIPTGLPLLVEREVVLQRLHTAWSQVRQGRRRVVLVTGEAGMGKTAVVEAFVAQVRLEPTVWLAYGRCVEHYGAGEAYLPVLEALGHLCHAPDGGRLVDLLRQQAPTWLVQLPWLLTDADRQQWIYELQGTTRERMLREFAEVVETLTAETPLVLVFEDLHWSDYATLDLLALLARRQTPARLLVLGTYRPVEAIVQGHPLRTLAQALRQHGHSTEVPLALLSPAAIVAYLEGRFPGHAFPASLGPWLHVHTEGNPLFLITLVQALVEQGVLIARDGCWTLEGALDTVEVRVPETLRQLIEHQLAYVPPEAQQVVEVASVAGVAFTTAAVAAGLDNDVLAVEAHCEELARRHLIRPVGLMTWPDGTVATRYEFTHALYQQVAYRHLGSGYRVRLHQRLGGCLEAAYGMRAKEIAAELADHFERGYDLRRAVHYLHQAAENATQRSAHHEVVHLATRALALLRQFPETPERAQQELALHMTLGPALIATKGPASPEVEQTYIQTRILCQQVPESPQLPQLLVGLCLIHTGYGEHQTAKEIGTDLLRLAQRLDNSATLLHAHGALGITALYLGEIVAARVHFDHGMMLADRLKSSTQILNSLFDFAVVCPIGAAIAMQQLGYADQARQRGEEALALTHEITSPYNRCNLLIFLALFYLFRREWRMAQQWVEEALSLATELGFIFYEALGTLVRGATLTAQGRAPEGLADIRQGLTACRTLGAKFLQPWGLAMLAESYAHLGQSEAGLNALRKAQALMATTSEALYAAEIARLEGELRLQVDSQVLDIGPDASPTAAAERCFQQALALARRQQARWWELRAAMSLARLWRQQGKDAAAYELLAPIYTWFTEGFDTADLRAAKALLETLR